MSVTINPPIFDGYEWVFGADKRIADYPIVNIPEGTRQVRKSIRNQSWAVIYCRGNYGTRKFNVQVNDERKALLLVNETESNRTFKAQ